ncbi:MAG: glycosyltransferase family 4 protein [Sedimentitalea sp.]|nr:glycosyltransferase family 4 protein [Sedimentitalea sp.]
MSRAERHLYPARPVAGPLHILLTVNSAWNAVNFRRALIAALLARGHRVTVLAPADAHAARLVEMGCRFVPLAMDNQGLSPLRDAFLWGRFIAQFRALRPDLVLGFTIKNNIYGAHVAARLGIPFLPNVTGLGTAFMGDGWLSRLAQTLYRQAFAAAPVVFFQNGDDRQLFLDRRLVRPGQVRMLPGSGIDLARFAPEPATMPGTGVRFLLIARLLRDKGVVEYAEAADRLRAAHPGARFQLLGALGAANRTAIDPGLLRGWVARGGIDYLGETDDVRPFIREADCIVLPSYREGTPRSLLEAGAMARPVIATAVPGCRDVVADGVTGLLCRAHDSADLARTMAEMIALGPARRCAMGAAGRRRIAAIYDEAHVVEAYRREIDRLALSPRPWDAAISRAGAPHLAR